MGPTVFVSYRRATTQIEQWTKRLIDYLRARGYDAKFDMENPVTDHMSIASFVSNLPHADMVVIVNTEEYATDKTRLWIREERHAAILAALDGHCDLLVLQCKDAPLADDWLAFFPTVRVDTGECCFDHLDKWIEIFYLRNTNVINLLVLEFD
jgi:hypothetical protein